MTWSTVVGVAEDVHEDSLRSAVVPALYLSVFDHGPSTATLVVRGAGDAATLAGAVREAVHRVDPALPLFRDQSGETLLSQSVAGPRFNATLLGTFAGLAFVLSAVGIFGVVSYGVTQRIREIGVRMALGTRAPAVAGWVLRGGLRPVALGIVLGMAGAFAASRLLATLVFGVTPADPLTYLGVALALAAVAAAAAMLPAWRAARVEPVVALRED